MRTSLSTVQVFFVLLCGAVVWGHVDVCPRHRGLSEGLVRAENRIRTRALYRIDLRHALTGFKPNTVYRFRVQTTYRPSKFNDATLVAEALDPKCGYGRLIVDTDVLYSPQHCPDVVTTQEKEPMGRAFFKWEAPSCGCVHFRARVHSDSKYYLEDEDAVNGPLARTVCIRDEYNVNRPEVTTTPKPEPLSRENKLEHLCEVSRRYSADDVLKNKGFNTERHLSVTNSFERDRLELALEQRKADTLACCDKGINMHECFGDMRRRRIDTFCGTGEPQIPFSKTRYDWIKQMENECCWQIGEDRYTCFNYTLLEEAMLKDGRMHESERKRVDKDDFDPANDLSDFLEIEDTHQKTPNGDIHYGSNQKTKEYESESRGNPVKNDLENDANKLVNESKSSVDVDNENTTEKAVNTSNEKNDEELEKENKDQSDKENVDIDKDSEADDFDVDDDEEGGSDENTVDEEEEDVDNEKEGEDDEDDDNSEDDDMKITSLETCCYSGISAGIRSAGTGTFDACFQAADRLQVKYTNWDTKCDRRFVVCCMHVIDGTINVNNIKSELSVLKDHVDITPNTGYVYQYVIGLRKNMAALSKGRWLSSNHISYQRSRDKLNRVKHVDIELKKWKHRRPNMIISTGTDHHIRRHAKDNTTKSAYHARHFKNKVNHKLKMSKNAKWLRKIQRRLVENDTKPK